MAKARTPSTIEEYRRLAHAFLVGSKLPAGSKAYVVMSTEAPLYRVQGIYASHAAAETAMKAGALPGFRWTAPEQESRVIYECSVPDMSAANELVILDEGSSTESSMVAADGVLSAETRAALRFENIETMQLSITVKGIAVTYTLANDTTAVFITQGAADAFLYSQYYAYFGPEYASERRKRTLKKR